MATGSLTREAEEAAKYLIQAKDRGMIELYFEFGRSYSLAGTVRDHRGISILSDKFVSPSLGALQELEVNGELIKVYEKPSSMWGVQLTGKLWGYLSGTLQHNDENIRFANKMQSFFISYAHPDKKNIMRLVKDLSVVYGSQSVWFDHHIRIGHEWWTEIIDQIYKSDVFIWLLSDNALKSVVCRVEFTEARRWHKFIIPIGYQLTHALIDINRTQIMFIKKIDQKSILEILGAIQQLSEKPSPIPHNSLWSKRLVEPDYSQANTIIVSVRVPANVEPKDDPSKQLCNTGIYLVAGDQLTIRASSQITNDKLDGEGRTFIEPDGYSVDGKPPSPIDGYAVMGYPYSLPPNKDASGSLFGWIGADKTAINGAFFVGKHFSNMIAVGEDGFLHLAVNDTKGMYDDNDGVFEVEITINHPKGIETKS